MTVKFNNVTKSAAKAFTHICSGTDLYVMVVAHSNRVGGGFSGCTYNGVAMTSLYSYEDNQSEGTQASRIWGLANPPVGQSDIVISGGGATFGAFAISYNGVCATAPCGTLVHSCSTDNNQSQNAVCLAGELGFDYIWSNSALRDYSATRRLYMGIAYASYHQVGDKPGPNPSLSWNDGASWEDACQYNHISVPLMGAAPHITDVQVASGTTLGHDTVYIVGRNFSSATSVKFGDAAASFNVNNDTQITVTTPPHDAGAIVVSVQTPFGMGTFSGYEFVSPIPSNNLDAIKNMRLNQKGIFYTSGSAARSGVVSARFFVPSDDGVCLGFSPRYGLIVNYYQESTYDVALANDIAQTDVTNDMARDNGIFAIYSPTEVDGLAGIALYYYKEGLPVRFLTSECTLPKDTWHWLKLSFVDGHIQVYNREDGNTFWELLIDTIYREEEMPWQAETFGRSGVYMENVTSHVDSLPFYSDDMIVPLQDYSILGPGFNARCPDAEDVDCMVGLHIMVDDEIIVTEGGSLAVVSAADTSELVVKEAYYYKDNITAFTGSPISVPCFDGVHPNNFYNNCALVMKGGSGGGRAFRITGYQKDTPNKWVPTGAYILPDTWQDHIGVAGFGAWVSSGMSRIFVFEDVDGVLTFDDTTTVQIVPGLIVTTRGHDSEGENAVGAAASTHDASVASVYTTKAVLCNWTNFYTCDVDWTLESIIRYIVEGSGGKCSFGSFVDGNITTTGGWGISPWYGSDGLSLRSFAASFTLPAMALGDRYGMIFRSPTHVPGTFTDGYLMTILSGINGYLAVLQKGVDDEWTDLEVMPIPFVPSGEVTFSVQDQVFSVWVNDLLVATFHDTSLDVGPYVAFTSVNPSTFHVRIGELCDFISMWAISASSNANEVLSEVLSDRRVYFSDDGKGGLFFYRLRRDAGTMPDIGLTYQLGQSSDAVTWTRGEGAKFIEDADPELLAKYGIRYMLVNTRWALNVDETLRFARWSRKDQEARANTSNFEIIPHPAYQVGDFLTVNFPTKTKVIDLMSSNLRLEVSDTTITCDQQMGAIDHAIL